jgi:pyridoxine 5-phosphate synthase
MGRTNMIKLGVNIDHVATVRQARLAKEPDIVRAAVLAEMGGAEGITVHLREDRRHIHDRDVKVLKQVVTTKLNLEMAAEKEMVDIACKVKPNMVTLVPEKREELTTEGGLNILDKEIKEKTSKAIKILQNSGIIVSLFVDPKTEIMKAAKDLGAEFVEIHTGKYSDALTEDEQKEEYNHIVDAIKAAKVMGLLVNAGHGLDYKNVKPIAKIKEIHELNIGHAIVARAIFVGLETAVKEMKELIVDARKS